MSITEELRAMLDNRGIKWDEIVDHENLMIGTRWKDSRGYFVTAFAYADCQHIKTFTDFFWQPTPKEAVEATLGSGTCHETIIDHHWRGCCLCGYIWEFMYGIGKCEHPRYCPNCGAKVVDK